MDSRPVNNASLFSPVKNNNVNNVKESSLLNAGKVIAAETKSLPNNPAVKNVSVQSGADVFKAAAAVLGIPQDALSRALLVFSRLFLIVPDTGFLLNLRKEILASGPSSPKTGKEKNQMEAKVLAALAAFDKGVSLSRESLPVYAITPDKENFFEDSSSRHEGRHSADQQPDARDLQQFFENFNRENSGKDGRDSLFGYLNRIPGKNGSYWIVWPFNYACRGTELKILVRILIKGSLLSSDRKSDEGLVITDITGPKRNWRFILNKTGDKSAIDVSIVPCLTAAEAGNLRKYLEKIPGFTDIRIHNGEELLLADEFTADLLPCVNEEV